MATPIYTELEAKTRETFTALMWALSHPGRMQVLPETASAYPGNFIAVGQTVLDLETCFYTPDSELQTQLERTTAQFVQPDKAEYLFFPTLDDSNLKSIEQASIGTMMYPDHGATLIVGCTLGQGEIIRCSGPGIQTTHEFQLSQIPQGLWQIRQQKFYYPLGWDVFFVCNHQVVGLPRSTTIERIS